MTEIAERGRCREVLGVGDGAPAQSTGGAESRLPVEPAPPQPESDPASARAAASQPPA